MGRKEDPAERIKLYGDAKATLNPLDRARKRKRLKQAEAAYQENPEDPQRIIEYADALFDMGELEKSLELLEGLGEQTSNDPELLYNLGFIYLKLGKVDEAVGYFKQVIEKAPDHPLARSAGYELWTIDPESYSPFERRRVEKAHSETAKE